MNPIIILLSAIGALILLKKQNVQSVTPSANPAEIKPEAITPLPSNINIGQIGATTSAFKLGDNGDGI